MRARRRMFAIVTSALTGALLLAAPAVHAATAGPAKPAADPAKSAADPAKKDLSTKEVTAKAGGALEETSDLFGDLGGKVEKTLNHGASLSTNLSHTTSNPLKQDTESDKDHKSLMSDSSKFSKLVGETADTVVNGVDDMIGSLDW